jgi:hypothetical protein
MVRRGGIHQLFPADARVFHLFGTSPFDCGWNGGGTFQDHSGSGYNDMRNRFPKGAKKIKLFSPAESCLLA